MSPINFSQVSYRRVTGMTCAEILVEYLKLEGVEFVFGIAGGTVVPFLEALSKEGSIRFIMCRHEAGAAFMADMYARASGRLGVCLSTAGPGATNMLTGVACAHRDGVPLLAITGQPATHTAGKGAVQESTGLGVDTVGIYQDTCGFSAQVHEPAIFGQMMTTALRLALGGHSQAVHLSFPMNVSSFRFPEYDLPTDPLKYRAGIGAVSEEKLDKVLKLLLAAERPAILVGSGGRDLADTGDLVTLAEKLRCPVVTSPQGKGLFPEKHPLSLGVFGFAGSLRARKYLLEESLDLLMVLGSRLDEWTTDSWDQRLSPDEYLIHIDSDYLNIGRNFPTSLGMVGPVADAVGYLARNLVIPPYAEKALDKRMVRISEFRRDCPAHIKPERRVDNSFPLKPARVMAELNSCLSPDALILADAGNSYAWTLHFLEINPPQRFLIGLGFASMGHASAGVVGAGLASPDREVIVIAGDGSMLMNGTEIHTAVQYRVPVIWIVLNDSGLGMVHHGMKLLTGRSVAARYDRVDFAALARVYGAMGLSVTRPGQISEVLEQVRANRWPAVIDVHIDPEDEPPFLERIKGLMKYRNQEEVKA
jgi:acetolactate synthase-1/2/3 large subunit